MPERAARRASAPRGDLGPDAGVILVCVAMLGWCVYAGPMPSASPAIILLLLAGLWLEMLAVPTGSFGLFSAGFACVLAMAILPGGGVRVAAPAALILLTVRTFHKRRDVLELLADLVAALLALSVIPLIPGPYTAFPAMATWLAVELTLPIRFARLRLPRDDLLRWLAVSRGFRLPRGAVALAGVPLGLLAGIHPLHVLWLVPLLACAHAGAGGTDHRIRAAERERSLERMKQSAVDWDSARDRVDATWRELQDVLEERRLTETFARQLAATRDPVAAMELILAESRRVVEQRSAAVFLPEDNVLLPACGHGPPGDPDPMESARLLGVWEPVVEEAWAKRTAVRSERVHLVRPRLFEAELSAVAIPLQDQGVLYIGRKAKPFSEEEIDRLTGIAGTGGLALQSTRHYQAQQEALHQYAEAHAHLEGWVGRLEALLAGAEAMASSLESGRILDALETQARTAVPHHWGTVEERCWGEGAPDPQAIEEIATVVRGNMRPLLLDDLVRSRFRPPFAGARSVLAAPMIWRDDCRGVVLLASQEPEAFTREHQDLLFVLACQTAAALSNASLFEEVVDAHRRLKESQAQLVQSSKMAAVGQLAAGVAHEINSPLGAILLTLDMTDEEMARAELVAKKLARARKAADRARKIIVKLLLYSRGSGPEQQAVDPVAVVQDAAEFLRPQLAVGGIELDLDLKPVPPVWGTSNELQQVLVNLVLNARDALERCESAPRRIRIFTDAAPDGVVLGVQDWGEGIDPEVLPRIFEPFFTLKPVGKGTGLGLSVSQQIVVQHGGRLEVASTPGQGATFTVHLPVTAEAP